MPMPSVGKKAPAFSLLDQDGKKVASKSLAGKWAVLYFYPKDMTPGCTTEACDFRDNMARLTKAGAAVYGVSPDPAERHRKFADKYELPFTLLADPEHTMLERYGVWQEKSLYGKRFMGVVRSTMLIDPEGVVREVWPKVKVKGHVDEVLERLAELSGGKAPAPKKKAPARKKAAAKKKAPARKRGG